MFRRILVILPAAFLLVSIPLTIRAQGAGAIYLANFFIRPRIIDQALVAFVGIAAIFLIYYSIRMIVDAQKESALTDGRQSFVYAFFGFAVIASAGAFVDAFAFGSTIRITGALVGVAAYLFGMATGIFVLMVTLAGFGMVMTQGDQGAFDKMRKVLIANCGGVVLMVLAKAFVTAIGTPRSGGAAIITELVGIANFILTIFGFGCAIAIIVAGIMLIVSIDEGLKDRAKNTVIGTLITLAIVLALRALLTFFLL